MVAVLKGHSMQCLLGQCPRAKNAMKEVDDLDICNLFDVKSTVYVLVIY